MATSCKPRMGRLSIIILTVSALFVSTSSQAQRNFKFKKSGGFDDVSGANVMTINLSLGGMGFGVTFGGEYERIFGAQGKFSFFMPASYSTTSDGFLTVADVGDRYHHYKSFYVAPGARFHPAGSYHKADFSLGLQMAVGSVNVQEDYITGVQTIVTNTTTSFVAPLGQINLNVCSPDGFVFGIFMGGGPVVSGDFGKASNGTVNNVGMFQMGIKLGGRF